MSLVVKIKKRIGAFFLDVNFEAENETMALLGSSGCGKSMTLKCIAGIETPDQGYIELNGRVLFDSKKNINLSVQQRKVGYLFQQYALFPNMTVAQNILIGIRNKKDRSQVLSQKISSLKLTGLEDKYPNELSGGQQQRVALARILVNEPEVLLLDEPFSALDSYLKWQLELELSDLLGQFGATTVFVSHSRDEVYRLCENVCVLNNGKSEGKTSVHQLFDSPRTVSACLLSGCKNFSSAVKIGDCRLKATDWGVDIETDAEVNANVSSIGIQAHHIEVSDKPMVENSFPCLVERVIGNIFSKTLVLSTPAGINGKSRLCVEVGKDEHISLTQREKVYVYIPKEYVITLAEN